MYEGFDWLLLPFFEDVFIHTIRHCSKVNFYLKTFDFARNCDIFCSQNDSFRSDECLA